MSFSVKILGCSSALPTLERFTTSQVVLCNETPYLVDCGEGVQTQMRKYSVPYGRLKNIFVSHIHGDHIFGLFGLISSFGMLGRKQDLDIFCPAQLEVICKSLFEMLGYELPYKINYHILDESGKQLIFKDKRINVYSFPLVHSKPVWGFLFKEVEKERNVNKNSLEEYEFSRSQIVRLKKGEDVVLDSGEIVKNEDVTFAPPKPRSYAFCSDTLPLKRLKEFIPDVDLLYHEATFTNEYADMAKQTCHSTAEQAAGMAKLVNAGKLILGHFSSRYKNVDEVLNEAKNVFPNTIAAFDGLIVAV